jgi:hypothetical protein
MELLQEEVQNVSTVPSGLSTKPHVAAVPAQSESLPHGLPNGSEPSPGSVLVPDARAQTLPLRSAAASQLVPVGQVPACDGSHSTVQYPETFWEETLFSGK